MPCSDSSSSMNMILNADETFRSFDFAKITCGREITAKTGFSDFCKGKTLEEILALNLTDVADTLSLESEEDQFILFMEWDALRAVIAQYLGIEHDDIDRERCVIGSIDQTEDSIEIALVILPPKEMPKILPCNLGDKRYNEYEKIIKEGY